MPRVEDGRLIVIDKKGPQRETVEGVYLQKLDRLIRDREIGLWIVKHKAEFWDMPVEQMRVEVPKVSGFGIDEITTVLFACSIFAKAKAEADDSSS